MKTRKFVCYPEEGVCRMDLAGERRRENYVSFQFKGGATDEQRRFKRVRLIGDILKIINQDVAGEDANRASGVGRET